MRLPICGMLLSIVVAAATPAFGASTDWDQCKDVNNKATAEMSLAACNRILKDPSEAKYHAMALRNRCGIRYTMDDLEGALADCNQAAHMEPQSAIVYNRRGLTWYTKRDNNRTISDYNQAIQLNPNYTLAYYNRGLARQAKGDTAACDADVAHAKKLQPDVGD